MVFSPLSIFRARNLPVSNWIWRFPLTPRCSFSFRIDAYCADRGKNAFSAASLSAGSPSRRLAKAAGTYSCQLAMAALVACPHLSVRALAPKTPFLQYRLVFIHSYYCKKTCQVRSPKRCLPGTISFFCSLLRTYIYLLSVAPEPL